MDREQELWAITLHVERTHGADGPRYIAEQIGRLALAGEADGIAMWKAVAERYAQLTPATPPTRTILEQSRDARQLLAYPRRRQ